jgi:uncharacterized protein with HEPN domain
MSAPTPERRAILYVEDIVKYSTYAITFLGGRSDEELQNDLQAQFAIVRALEVVGEATRSVPDEIRRLAPHVPWRDIVAMRNRIVHHYFGVRLGIVLNVVRQDLPPLIQTMTDLLALLETAEHREG